MTDFVTVGMDDIRFRAPGHRGDIITVYSRIVATGRTSVTAESKAFVEKPSTDERHEMINCTIAYVCLKNRAKYAYFESEEYAEWLRRRGRMKRTAKPIGASVWGDCRGAQCAQEALEVMEQRRYVRHPSDVPISVYRAGVDQDECCWA